MKKVTNSDTLPENCVVKFGATWCAPCHAVKPVLEMVESETGVTVFDVDIDENEMLAQQFNVRSVPTVFVVKNSKPVKMVVGAKDKNTYVEMVKELNR